jgi:hypothetical protein
LQAEVIGRANGAIGAETLEERGLVEALKLIVGGVAKRIDSPPMRL